MVGKNIAVPKRDSDSVFVVAFGSCNKQDKVNPFWDDVLTEAPDVWIWGGDNIYADTDNTAKMRSMYEEQMGNRGYKRLAFKVPVIGTWDDHDYGINDGGEEFHGREKSQQLFLDFMGVPKTSERRKRKGVYASHDFSTSGGGIRILVLDTRYFRSPLEKDNGPNRRYKINDSKDATILGESQWKWLGGQLGTSQADFNLIVTSIQFLSREHGFETWGNFPNEVEKLERIIGESGAKGVIFLSGDRHISEFSRVEIKGVPYPLLDFTSSGLTHSYSGYTFESNANRIGKVVSVPSFGVIWLDLDKKKVHLKIMGENGKVFQELEQAY